MATSVMLRTRPFTRIGTKMQSQSHTCNSEPSIWALVILFAWKIRLQRLTVSQVLGRNRVVVTKRKCRVVVISIGVLHGESLWVVQRRWYWGLNHRCRRLDDNHRRAVIVCWMTTLCVMLTAKAFATIGPKMQRETTTWWDSEPSFWPFVSISAWKYSVAKQTGNWNWWFWRDLSCSNRGSHESWYCWWWRGNNSKMKYVSVKRIATDKKGGLHSSAGDYRGQH